MADAKAVVDKVVVWLAPPPTTAADALLVMLGCMDGGVDDS